MLLTKLLGFLFKNKLIKKNIFIYLMSIKQLILNKYIFNLYTCNIYIMLLYLL